MLYSVMYIKLNTSEPKSFTETRKLGNYDARSREDAIRKALENEQKKDPELDVEKLKRNLFSAPVTSGTY